MEAVAVPVKDTALRGIVSDFVGAVAKNVESTKTDIAGLAETSKNLIAAVHKNRIDIDTNTAGVTQNKSDIAALIKVAAKAAEKIESLDDATHQERTVIAGLIEATKNLVTANRTEIDKNRTDIVANTQEIGQLRHDNDNLKQQAEESALKQKQCESEIAELKDIVSKALSSNLFSGSGAAKVPPTYSGTARTQLQEHDSDSEDEFFDARTDGASAFQTNNQAIASTNVSNARMDEVSAPTKHSKRLSGNGGNENQVPLTAGDLEALDSSNKSE